MRLVLDRVFPEMPHFLRELGYDCTHVGEVGMSKAADDEILAWSLKQNATVVTLDADFHSILAVSGATNRPRLMVRRLHDDRKGVCRDDHPFSVARVLPSEGNNSRGSGWTILSGVSRLNRWT